MQQFNDIADPAKMCLIASMRGALPHRVLPSSVTYPQDVPQSFRTWVQLYGPLNDTEEFRFERKQLKVEDLLSTLLFGLEGILEGLDTSQQNLQVILTTFIPEGIPNFNQAWAWSYENFQCLLGTEIIEGSHCTGSVIFSRYGLFHENGAAIIAVKLNPLKIKERSESAVVYTHKKREVDVPTREVPQLI